MSAPFSYYCLMNKTKNKKSKRNKYQEFCSHYLIALLEEAELLQEKLEGESLAAIARQELIEENLEAIQLKILDIYTALENKKEQ